MMLVMRCVAMSCVAWFATSWREVGTRKTFGCRSERCNQILFEPNENECCRQVSMEAAREVMSRIEETRDTALGERRVLVEMVCVLRGFVRIWVSHVGSYMQFPCKTG